MFTYAPILVLPQNASSWGESYTVHGGKGAHRHPYGVVAPLAGISGGRRMSIEFQNIKAGRGGLWASTSLEVNVNNDMRTQVLSSISPNLADINHLWTEVQSDEPRHKSCLLVRIILAHSGNTGYLVTIKSSDW